MARSLDLRRGSQKVVDLRQSRRVKTTISKPKKKRSNKKNYSRMNRSPKRKSKKPFYTLVFLILILLIAIISSMFMSNNGDFTSESVKVSLSSPKAVASGEEVKLVLNYENIDKVALKDIEVVIQYPEGFFFNSATLDPIGQEKNVWQLNSIGPGESASLEINGQLIGKKNDNKEFLVTLYYMPLNFNSTFKADLSSNIEINDVLFEVDIEAPSDINKGDEVEFKVNYKNTTAQEMNGIQFEFLLGDYFEIIESTSTSSLVFDLEKIPAHESGEIYLKGVFSKEARNEVNWQFNIKQDLVKDNVTEQRLIYIEERIIKINSPEISLILEMLNKDNLVWGGNAEFKLNLENLGKTTINNALLTIDTNSFVIDYDRVNVANSDLQIKTLVFSPDIGGFGNNLKEIKEDDSYELTFSLPLLSQGDDFNLISPEELMIEAIATLSFNFATKNEKVISSLETGYIIVDTELITEARYYLDQYTVVGSGPIPPTVGEETEYMIYWKVFSGPHGLNDFEVKTSLPPYITYKGGDGSTTAGSLNYDETSREIKWTLDDISARTQIMASFEVGVIPEGNQINQLLILTNPTQLTGVEKETDSPISKNSNLLTSELLGDPRVEKQGKVIAP
ncbi:hypothetical protein HOE31_03465 [bacterium]|jgi:hypothetical protein|nr:hypothetical protein [bacterium]MBT4121977.1 hypothetical protein [bacterium]MBT4335480.1 hypothetical protein [bacterium]MBT4495206.1 hypothetical protein [bacterium]MBT4764392.1 hypothetical protein [bacterium]